MELNPLNKENIVDTDAELVSHGSASDAIPEEQFDTAATAQQQPAPLLVQEQPSNQPAAVQQPVQVQQVQATAVPKIDFAPTPTAGDTPVTVDKATQKANEIVGEVFGQAVLHTVTTDEEVRDQLLTTAKKVIQDKTETIADASETENKAQHFKKHEDACSYFGYEEKTTSKFHVRAMAFWAFVLNTIYIFTVGYFVVAPVSFILKKLVVVVKKTWLAVILALLIYLFIVVGIPAISILVAKLTGGNSEEVAETAQLVFRGLGI